MANSITLAEKFVPVIDDIYKRTSVTEGMDSATQLDFTGVNEVKVLKVSTTGLGDYSREDGYPKGDVTASWETMTLSEERGKEISIDRMDNEETRTGLQSTRPRRVYSQLRRRRSLRTAYSRRSTRAAGLWTKRKSR